MWYLDEHSVAAKAEPVPECWLEDDGVPIGHRVLLLNMGVLVLGGIVGTLGNDRRNGACG